MGLGGRQRQREAFWHLTWSRFWRDSGPVDADGAPFSPSPLPAAEEGRSKGPRRGLDVLGMLGGSLHPSPPERRPRGHQTVLPGYSWDFSLNDPISVASNLFTNGRQHTFQSITKMMWVLSSSLDLQTF